MSAAPLATMVWLPAHPAVGAVSMDRYWRELERERQQEGTPEGWQIVSPLGNPPQESARGGLRQRAWHKYLAYPLAARRAAHAGGVRVVHVLDHSFAHLLARMPAEVFKVATVHDLAPLRDGTDLTPRQQARFRRTVDNLHRADLVLADSRHSANDALELLALKPERLRVLPLGVQIERFARRTDNFQPVPAWRQLWAGRRVVLSVGTATSRKNLEILPGIFRALQKELPGLSVGLLRIGQPLPTSLRNELWTVLGQDGVVELGLAPEAELVAAYQHADALLFPSRLEGFGFPVLEAMAADCPVVCTGVTSLPEVGGAAALYFDPDDPAAAAAHLQRLFTDAGFRGERVCLGNEQAKRFSWLEHYRQLWRYYQQGRKAA